MREKFSLNTIIVLLFLVVVVMGYGLTYLSARKAPMSTEAPAETEFTDLLPTPETTDSDAIYYDESATAIPAEEREAIAARFVNPLREYTAWIKDGDPIVSVSIRIGPAEIGGQYLATVSHQSGQVEDLTIARDENGIAWWRPECPQGCVYSTEFAQKYPEIVSPPASAIPAQ